jgi:hypothetical protein
MALVYADRVRETTATTGTGTLTLAGAAAGFRSFAAVGNGNTCHYCVESDAGDWEVGLGTYTASGTTLARTTVLASSNGGSAVNLPAGTKRVFLTVPAAAVPPVTAVSGETVGGSYSITATSGTFAATGISVTLPEAGTYQIVAQVRGEVQPSAAGAHYIVGKFRNTTDSADVANSECLVVLSSQNGVNVNLSANMAARVTVAASKTVELWVARVGTSFTNSQILSDTNGRTKLYYFKIDR